MNTKQTGNIAIIALVIGVVILGGGAYLLTQNQGTSTNQNNQPTSEVTQTTPDEMADTPTQPNPDTNQDDSQAPTEEAGANGQYLTYSPANFQATSDQRRVLFFHASWCPTCKVANEELTENADQLPEDVVVLKTDYDTQTELKQKYGVTYQHTFVQVDENGEAVAKWNGGGVQQINQEVI